MTYIEALEYFEGCVTPNCERCGAWSCKDKDKVDEAIKVAWRALKMAAAKEIGGDSE